MISIIKKFNILVNNNRQRENNNYYGISGLKPFTH